MPVFFCVAGIKPLFSRLKTQLGSQQDAEDQSQGTHAPAVVGEVAELALVGEQVYQADGKIAHHGGDHHPHQIDGEHPPINALLDGVLQAQDIGAEDGGEAQEEGVADGEGAVEAPHEAGCDGGAGAGEAGDGGDGLAHAH